MELGVLFVNRLLPSDRQSIRAWRGQLQQDLCHPRDRALLHDFLGHVCQYLRTLHLDRFLSSSSLRCTATTLSITLLFQEPDARGKCVLKVCNETALVPSTVRSGLVNPVPVATAGRGEKWTSVCEVKTSSFWQSSSFCKRSSFR